MNGEMNTKIQTAARELVASIAGVMRNSFNFADLQGKIFADILSQATSQESSKADGKEFMRDIRADWLCSVSNSDYSIRDNAENKRTLRDFFNRIRQEAREQSQSRQFVRKSCSAGEYREEKTENSKTQTVESNSGTEESTEISGNNEAVNFGTNISSDNIEGSVECNKVQSGNDDKVQQQTDEAVLVLDFMLEEDDSVSLNDMEKDCPLNAEKDSDNTNSVKDFMQAENAAFFILHKFFHERAISAGEGEEKEGETAKSELDGNEQGEQLKLLSDLFKSNFMIDIARHRAKFGWGGEEQQSLLEQTQGADFLQSNIETSAAGDFTGQFIFNDGGKKESSFLNPDVRNDSIEKIFDIVDRFTMKTVQSALSTAANAVEASLGGEGADEAVNGVSSASGAKAQSGTAGGSGAISESGFNGIAKNSNGYDFAGHLTAARTQTRGSSVPVHTPLEQVIMQLNKQIKNGQQEMSLQLRPAELGRIEIKLSFSEGNKVNGTIIADNPNTLELLQKDSLSLQKVLQDAGLQADAGSLQFALRDDGQAGMFSSREDKGIPNYDGRMDYLSANSISDDFMEGENTETWLLTPGRVNLRV